MILQIRDNNGRLLAKDILDINFDMFISKEGDHFILNINHKYRTTEAFQSEEEAEAAMLHIVNVRNTIESRLFSEE